MSENLKYEAVLPRGWALIDFAKSCEKISLNGIKIKQRQYLPKGKYPVIDQGQELIGGYYDDEKLIVPSEPPYVIFGDHTRVKKYINFRFIAGADGVKVLKPFKFLNEKLLFYFLHCIKLPDKGYARHLQFLEKADIPLPPLPEQRRIVAKIEALFSSLDKGIESLKTSQQQLKVYRQAVLKWAFEGKLTNKNVVEGELPVGWTNVKLSNVCDKITDGSHFSPKSVNIGLPYVTVKDLKNDTIDFSKCLKITKKDYNNLSKNDCNPLRNDVLFSKDGTVGKVALINYDLQFVVLSSLAILRPHPKIILSEYLFYILKSSQFLLQALNQKKGVAIRRIILRDLKEINLNLPPIPEQRAIVQEIESRLSVCDKIEESITYSLKQAEALRQSILKKAFEGKLVPQDPWDEPASKLLERIKADREALKKKK